MKFAMLQIVLLFMLGFTTSACNAVHLTPSQTVHEFWRLVNDNKIDDASKLWSVGGRGDIGVSTNEAENPAVVWGKHITVRQPKIISTSEKIIDDNSSEVLVETEDRYGKSPKYRVQLFRDRVGGDWKIDYFADVNFELPRF